METPYEEIRRLQQRIDFIEVMINTSKPCKKKQKLIAKRKKLRDKILKLKKLEITQ